MRSPVPQEVLEELSRVVGRWHQLPLGHALSCMPSVRAAVQQLADVGAREHGRAPVPVPELGPEAVMDQLTVMVYDAFAAGQAGPAEPAPAVPRAQPAQPAQRAQVAQVAQVLADLRRSL